MSAAWSQTALRASLTDATPVSATDGRTNTEMNCVNGPTKLEGRPTTLERKQIMLENGTKKVVRREAQQFLRYHIAAGHRAYLCELSRVSGNPYRTHFPARYRGFQSHCTRAIGATPMMRHTSMPANALAGDN